jgi:hypothetical protein
VRRGRWKAACFDGWSAHVRWAWTCRARLRRWRAGGRAGRLREALVRLAAAVATAGQRRRVAALMAATVARAGAGDGGTEWGRLTARAALVEAFGRLRWHSHRSRWRRRLLAQHGEARLARVWREWRRHRVWARRRLRDLRRYAASCERRVVVRAWHAWARMTARVAAAAAGPGGRRPPQPPRDHRRRGASPESSGTRDSASTASLPKQGGSTDSDSDSELGPVAELEGTPEAKRQGVLRWLDTAEAGEPREAVEVVIWQLPIGLELTQQAGGRYMMRLSRVLPECTLTGCDKLRPGMLLTHVGGECPRLCFPHARAREGTGAAGG